MKNSKVDRDHPLLLADQVKSQLLSELKSASAKRQDFSDTAVMKRFRVGRATARAAITELVRQGLLKRIRGRGTFLAPLPHLDVSVDGVERWVQEWNLPDLDPGTKILTFRTIRAPANVAARLKIPAGSTVLFMRRIRTSRGEPAVLETRHVAGWCSKLINRADAEREMLFQIIAKAGVPTVSVEHEIGAELADSTAAKILKVAVGSPLLSRRVTFFASNDRPILTGVGLYRADRFTFHTKANL